MYNNVPIYLQELRPETNFSRHNRNLRSNNDLTLPQCRINKYKNSFLPKAITLWNHLSTDAKNISNYFSFKSYLEKSVSTTNSLFYVGNRKFNIIMARLRMKCSDLCGHLFQLKIVDDPRCKCGYMFEDSVHFFLVCPLYRGPISTLLNFIGTRAPITLQTLLCGNPELDSGSNKDIILQTMKFIEDSKRFD